MNNMYIPLLLLLALSCANALYTDVANNSPFQVVLSATSSSDAAMRQMEVFRIFMPQNTNYVQITAIPVPFNSEAVCQDPMLHVGVRGLPCNLVSGDYPSSSIVPCSEYWRVNVSSTIFLDPSSSLSIRDQAYGTWWYLGFRKASDDFNKDCKYNAVVNITTCPAGQMSVAFQTESPGFCAPVQAIQPSAVYSVNVNSTTSSAVYELNFNTPQDVLFLNYTIVDSGVSPYISLIFLGQEGFANSYVDQRCEASSSVDGVGIQQNMTCYGLPAGPYYITAQNLGANSLSGYLSVTTSSCPTGFSGIDCASPVIAYSVNSTIESSLSCPNGAAFGAMNYYIDFPENSTGDLNITVTSTNRTAYLIYKKDSLPLDDIGNSLGSVGNGWIFSDRVQIHGGASVTLYLRSEDILVGGRYYFSVVNEDSNHVVNYTISSTSTVTVPLVIPPTTSTTESSSTAASSGATGSASTGSISSSSGGSTSEVSTTSSTTGGTTEAKGSNGFRTSVNIGSIMLIFLGLLL